MLGKCLYLKLAFSIMNLEKYSFVMAGELRQKIVKLLDEPKTPTQLKDAISTQDSSIARTLRELSKEKIVVCLFPRKKKGKLYQLTKEGNQIRSKISL